ncbi:recombination repair protein 1-like, partial [Nilaparvata lugens]|uniref:recombination repair protein 1-like n=1 Tax=Nilaparvata lugens TaxID=108931 RepID=UPI00193D7FA1
MYSKVKPIEVKFGLGSAEFDDEGRVITAEFEKFFLVNTYVVNAGAGLKTLSKRLKWDELFRNHLKELDAKKPVILTGDLNVAHNPIDLANPKTNTKSAGFTIEERDGFTELLKCGFVDTFRDLYPDKEGCYSYWTYMGNARSRNV